MLENINKYKFLTIFLYYLICIYKPDIQIYYQNDPLSFPYYENNINYSNYTTSIKAIALYNPKISFSLIYDTYKDFNYQRKLSEEKEEENLNIKNVENEIELAKSHGIYGFGIYYYFNYYSSLEIFNNPLDIIFNNKNIDFNYFLILKSEDCVSFNSEIKSLIKEEYDQNKLYHFFDNISKYLLDERYIKINNSPIIGINFPENVPNLNQLIYFWRNQAMIFGIKKIFILGTLNNRNLSLIKDELNIDAYVYLPSYSNIIGYFFNSKIVHSYYGLIYENNFETLNYTIFKSSLFHNPNYCNKSNMNIFKDYTCYKFYLLNKQLIDFTKNNYEKEKQFLFINNFNNLIAQDTLKNEGYASINSFSKALFNLSFSQEKYDLINLEKLPLIAIQAHIFYVNCLEETIEKINNIPVKFDLYITTPSEENKNIISKYLELNNKAEKYEILIAKNIGRDVVPFINQLSKVYKQYKYFCHIHTKKTKYAPLGDRWRRYLYNNLLGSKETISEILYKFETNEKLGVIFPDNYYCLTDSMYIISNGNMFILNHLLKDIFYNYKLDKTPDYAAGNMFWARVSAVYQVFEKVDYINYYCPRESGQTFHTIMHAIERIWVIVAQLNGYNYTTIFKYY